MNRAESQKKAQVVFALAGETVAKGVEGLKKCTTMNGIVRAIAIFAAMFAMTGCSDDDKPTVRDDWKWIDPKRCAAVIRDLAGKNASASKYKVNEKVVLDLCKYMLERQKEFAITAEQIESFRNSEERAARYSGFYEVLTSVGIPGDVAKSELAKFVFHGKAFRSLVKKYDAYVGDVKSQKSECKRIRKVLKSGNVPDARIARYLVGFLVATPEDRRQLEKDCSNFIKMYGIVADFVRETVTEAEDAETIFTNGTLDEEIRDESRRRRKNLEICSMMAPMSKEAYIEKMTNGSAVAQMGFEIFIRKGISVSLLGFSGVLYRHVGMSDSVRLKGIKAAEEMAERILDLQKANVVDSFKDEEMKEKVLCVQWRIARIARRKAQQEQCQGLTEQARRSVAMADSLDECNSALKRILSDMDAARTKAESKMTPRERLQAALRRADFEKAKEHAKTVLAADPDDPDANFAMGMWHYQHERWEEAEKYLLRCRKRKPKQVAFLNNLAMIYLKTGRYDEAMRYARHALSVMPDSPDVKDTIDQIEKARAK